MFAIRTYADEFFGLGSSDVLSALMSQNSASGAAAAAASDDHSIGRRPGGAISTHIPVAVQNFMVETLHRIIESYCHRHPYRGICRIKQLFTRDAIASDLSEL